jgi:hypothetical protein
MENIEELTAEVKAKAEAIAEHERGVLEDWLNKWLEHMPNLVHTHELVAHPQSDEANVSTLIYYLVEKESLEQYRLKAGLEAALDLGQLIIVDHIIISYTTKIELPDTHIQLAL